MAIPRNPYTRRDTLFRQTVKIRFNGPYLQEHLLDGGYVLSGPDNGECLIAYSNGTYQSIPYQDYHFYPGYDCGVYTDVFIALSALTDKTDYAQWFFALEGYEGPFRYIRCWDTTFTGHGRCLADTDVKVNSAMFTKADELRLINRLRPKHIYRRTGLPINKY